MLTKVNVTITMVCLQEYILGLPVHGLCLVIYNFKLNMYMYIYLCFTVSQRCSQVHSVYNKVCNMRLATGSFIKINRSIYLNN